MSLPATFENPADYFRECITFFKVYHFLYDSPNTHILVNDILEHINIENLNKITIDENFDLRNNFLEEFFVKLRKFKVTYDNPKDINVDVSDVPLSEKKKHEIYHLAKEIEVVCEESGCNTVVDFGAGLGYLDQQLYEKTKYKILAIECNDSHYVGAKTRQRKYHKNSIENVKYIKHTINENSHAKIQEYLDDKYGRSSFCITGLHACGDLTVTALNLFLKMADAKSMVLMPCCYHLMTIENDRFKHFPLSDCLKGVFEDLECYEYLRIPFLRLGVQPPGADDNLEEKVFSLMARAVLELYAHNHGYKIKRTKRKAVKLREVNRNFEVYIHAAQQGYTRVSKSNNSKENLFKDNTHESKLNIDELTSIWREISDLTFKKAAIFILLQEKLRPIIDNLILYDRLVYLKENGLNNCEYKKIFNENISPRCLALLVLKNK